MNTQDNCGKMIEKLCNYFATIILQKYLGEAFACVKVFAHSLRLFATIELFNERRLF
jgi:hypothetical protein